MFTNAPRQDFIVPLKGEERAALDQMAQELDMSPENVMRAALRLYQSVHVRTRRGERLAYTDADGKLIPAFPMFSMLATDLPEA